MVRKQHSFSNPINKYALLASLVSSHIIPVNIKVFPYVYEDVISDCYFVWNGRNNVDRQKAFLQYES